MTTEPRDRPAVASRSTANDHPNAPSPDEGDSSHPKLTEGLRRDEIERLRLDPAPLAIRILTGGLESIRVHNSVGTARAAFEHAALQLDPSDRLELETETAASTLQLDQWSFLYRNRTSDRLLAYGHFGRLGVELAVERWTDSESGPSGDLAHRAQRAPSAASSTVSELQVHSSTLDDETFSEAWRGCESFDETHTLERAARTSREELLMRLPPEFARALSPERVTDIFEALPCYEDRVEVVIEGRGHRTRLSPTALHSRARGSLLLGSGDQTQLALDRRHVGGAYLVEMPGESGSLQAVEFVDGTGEFAARIQRPSNLSPSRVLSWRASLHGGCRC